MKTTHQIHFSDSKYMKDLASESIDLIVTSPPYPMIEMWDGIFSNQNEEIGQVLSDNQGEKAFELMHQLLDQTWSEVYRVLKRGGIACINIGDATRTIGGNFKIYSNHSRIINYCLKIGFQCLPEILWRKQTNAPNKFMGSGMLPPGAYVTLEHEFILIFRKGEKREFKTAKEKELRQESAYFWEERNIWFSDVWMDIKGVGQNIEDKGLRSRSAAFPFEVAYRLINMFSVKQDTVLDPFYGTGTTALAAMASERNSVGYEIDPMFSGTFLINSQEAVQTMNQYIEKRLVNHIAFIKNRMDSHGEPKGMNAIYGFHCVSNQENGLFIRDVDYIIRKEDPIGIFEAGYKDTPQVHIKHLWNHRYRLGNNASTIRGCQDDRW